MADSTYNDQIKLFSQFQIDPRSEEAMLAQAEKDRISNALAGATKGKERYMGESAIKASGAGFGALLRNKLDDPELTHEQKQSLLIKQRATDAWRDKLNEPGFAAKFKKTPELKNITMLNSMARSYFEMGDIEKAGQASLAAAQLQRQVEEMYRERDKDKSEEHREEEAAKRDAARVALEERRVATGEAAERRMAYQSALTNQKTKKEIGEPIQVVVPDSEGNFPVDSLESDTMTLQWNPKTGAYEDDKGNPVTSYMTFDQAMDLKEWKQKMAEAENSGLSDEELYQKRKDGYFKALGGSERTGMRMQFDALDIQTSVMNEVADMFLEAMEAGKPAGDFLDGTGKVLGFVDNVSKSIANAGGTFFAAIAQGADEDILLGRGQVVAADPRNLDKLREAGYGDYIDAIEIPDWIKNSEDSASRAARYQSAIVQLAYAIARSNEPGARQLSDADFRHALAEIGANSADPKKLAAVILQNMTRKARSVENNIERAEDIGGEYNLTPKQSRTLIWGSRPLDRGITRMNQVLDRYANVLPGQLQLDTQRREIEEATGIAAEPLEVEESAAESPQMLDDNIQVVPQPDGKLLIRRLQP